MVMTVQCSSCQAGFPVDPAKIPEGGVNVRCSACGAVFRVERPTEEAPAAPVEEALGAVSEPVTEEAPPEAVAETETDAAADPDEWVFETEEDVDPDSLDIQPVGTVEEERRAGPADTSSFFGGGGGEPVVAEDDASADPGETPTFEMDGGDLELEETAAPSAPADEPTEPAEEPEEEAQEGGAAPAAVGGFTFGQRDPKEKARRLARVLVSDMIMYNPERHERALANGTLKDDFEEEIAKSWKEYVEQVGEEMAEGTDFWTEALNDVLAKGESVF